MLQPFVTGHTSSMHDLCRADIWCSFCVGSIRSLVRSPHCLLYSPGMFACMRAVPQEKGFAVVYCSAVDYARLLPATFLKSTREPMSPDEIVKYMMMLNMDSDNFIAMMEWKAEELMKAAEAAGAESGQNAPTT